MYGLCFARSLNSDVRKFLDASFQVICFALAVASLLVSLQLLTTAHCDQVDGLLRCCLLFSGFSFQDFSAEMYAGLLASGCLFSKHFYARHRKL